MTRHEVEDRVRAMAWPAPSVLLRERVLEDAASQTGALNVRHRQWMPSADANQPPRRRWRPVLAFIVISALLVIGACAGFDAWKGRELDAEIARLDAKYGSLDPSTMKAPAIPDADNRAQVVRAAAALAVPLAGAKYHYIALPVASPVSAEMRAFADSNRDAIRAVWDVRMRRRSNWEFDARTGDNFPPWDRIRILSDAIYITTLLDLEAGRADDAAQTIVSGLGILASMRPEPQLSYFSNAMVTSRLLEGTRQILTTSTPSTAALRDLAWWLSENRKTDWMQLYLLGHLKQVNATFERMEHGDISPMTAHYIYPMTWPEWPAMFLGPAAQIGRPFVRTARLRYLQHMERLLDARMGPRPRPAMPEPEAPSRWALVDRLTDKFTAGTWGDNDRADDEASEFAATELAVALRRYKMDHGVYPDELAALVPTYLDRLPIDPYTVQPPVYARQGEGFTLRATSSNPFAVKWRALEWNVAK